MRRFFALLFGLAFGAGLLMVVTQAPAAAEEQGGLSLAWRIALGAWGLLVIAGIFLLARRLAAKNNE